MRRTILLADDSLTIQRLVTQTFADGDFSIVSVSNGELAIRKLDDVRPDLILADVYMPGKSGYEVCAYVRAHPQFSATPVVLLVGAFDAFDEETARQAGASSSITKPFEPQALVDLVVSLLDRGTVRSGEEDTLVEDGAMDAVPAGPVVTRAVPNPVPGPAPAASAAAVAAEPPTGPLRVPNTPPTPMTKPMVAFASEPEDSAPLPEESDLLGLEALFKEDPPRAPVELSDADIERIADRVMQKLSVLAIESVAWDIVPDIVDKILRESPKRVV